MSITRRFWERTFRHGDWIERHGVFFRNVAWLSVASLIVKPFWLIFITIACARLLNAEGYGVLNTALSMSALAFSITGLGMRSYVVREVAAEPSRAAYLLSQFLSLRLGLGVLAVGSAIGAGWFLGYQAGLLLAVLIACIYQTCFSIVEFIHSFFQAFERLKYQALSVVSEKVLVIACGFLALVLTQSPGWVLFGMAIGMLATAGGTLGLAHVRVVPIQLAFPERGFLTDTLRPLTPYALAGVLGMFFFRVDTIMVEALLGLEAAGQYGLAFRIVEALSILPYIVIYAALYPRLSRLWSAGEYRDVIRLVRLASAGLFALSIPLVLMISFLASWLVGLIVTDVNLLPAASALQVLVWAFPLTCVRTVLYCSLLAAGAFRPLISVLTFGLAANIGMNLYGIPAFGIVGAAGATIVSEAVVFCLYVFVWRRLRPNH